MMAFRLRANGASLPTLDVETVRRALLLFSDPEHHVFLQCLPSAKWSCFRGSDYVGMEKWITDNCSGSGVYFGINPIVEVDRPTRVGDVVKRRWILIDIDRNKTLQPDDPATVSEHEKAMELALEVQTFLGDVGFPAPIQVDSGNGFHLYYRVDLPNDNEHRDLVHEFLKLLDNTFSGEKGDIGEECFDSRRISRVPGTWSRRGEQSKERQYSQSKFVYVPRQIDVVPTELIRKIIAEDKKEAAPLPEHANGATNGQPFKLKANTRGDENAAYGKSALERECSKLASTPPNGRNNQLFKSAAALYELVAGGELGEMEVRDGLFQAAVACGLADDKAGGGDRGIIQTIDSGKKHGLQNPRAKPKQEEKTSAAKFDPKERVIVFASEITPRKIEWLWPGRIPLGMMTTFAGSGGLGKTFVLTDIAARVSRGEAWPDGTPGNRPGKVLYVSGEDNADDTLVPRLIAAGGIRENVAYFKPEYLGQFSLERIDMLDAALDQLGKECMLVCIDPPTSFLAGTDDHKNSELRELLTPIGEWAARRRVAVVFITHVNKGGAGKVDAVMRIIGSVAWSTAVRAAHMFCPDPDDPDRHLFLVAKINGAKKRQGIAYQIHQIDPADMDGPARVHWLGQVDTTANEAMAGQSRVQSRGQVASEWLIEKFREKLEWEADELFREAKSHNISRNAIFDAKAMLDLPKARKKIHLGGTTSWVWWVPENWHGFNCPDSEIIAGTVGTLGTLETEVLEI